MKHNWPEIFGLCFVSACAALAIAGWPNWLLSSGNVAEWFSAIATVFAVAVALYFGLRDGRNRQRDALNRAKITAARTCKRWQYVGLVLGNYLEDLASDPDGAAEVAYRRSVGAALERVFDVLTEEQGVALSAAPGELGVTYAELFSQVEGVAIALREDHSMEDDIPQTLVNKIQPIAYDVEELRRRLASYQEWKQTW